MADLNLDKVVQKYQQKLANADLAATVAEVRAEEAEAESASLKERIAYLEGILEEKENSEASEPKKASSKK